MITTHAIRPTAEARELWRAFVIENERRLAPGQDMAHMTDWGSKASGLVLRVCGTLHAVESLEPAEELIPVERMARAIALVRCFTVHARVAFGTMHADPAVEVAKAILSAIQERHEGGTVNARDVHRDLRGTYHKAADLAPGWDLLVERGYVRAAPTKEGPGRPSISYEVRPGIVHSVHGCQRDGEMDSEREEDSNFAFRVDGQNGQNDSAGVVADEVSRA